MVVRPITPPQMQITVTIDEVDISTRTVHAHDKTNAPIQASFRTAPGAAMRIPAQGDLWTAQRIGFQWYLGERIDTVAEHAYANDSMGSGDTRLASDGTLHVLSDSIIFNGQPIGATTYEVFTADGISNTYNLEIAPVSAHSVQAFVNGLLVDPRGITVTGSTLTFLIPPPAGFFVVYYERWGYVYSDAAVVSGKGAVSSVEPASANQPAIARIQKILSANQPAVAHIASAATPGSHTQPAVARVQKTFTKTQSALARIQATLTHNQTALATVAPVWTTPPVTLDNFNRADGALGSLWTLNELGESASDLAIITDTLGRTGTTNGGTAYLNWFTEDRTIAMLRKSIQYTTIMAETNAEVAIHYLVSNFGASTLDGYHLEYSNGTLSLYEIVGGTFSPLAEIVTPLSAGDSFGVILTTSGDHYVYTNHGGTWHPIFHVHHTGFSVGATGIKMGAVTDARLDNLLGTTQNVLGYNTIGTSTNDNSSGTIECTGNSFTTDANSLKLITGFAHFQGFSSAGTQSQKLRLAIFADNGSGTGPSTTVVAVTDEVVVTDSMVPGWVEFSGWTEMGGAPTLAANTKYWLAWWTGPTGAGGGLALINFHLNTIGGGFVGDSFSSAAYSSTANPTVTSWSVSGSSEEYALYFVLGN